MRLPTQHALLSCLCELSHYTPFKPTPCSLKAMRTGNAPTGPPHSPNQGRDETRGSRIATGLGSPPRRHRNRAHRRLARGRGHCERTASSLSRRSGRLWLQNTRKFRRSPWGGQTWLFPQTQWKQSRACSTTSRWMRKATPLPLRQRTGIGTPPTT